MDTNTVVLNEGINIVLAKGGMAMCVIQHFQGNRGKVELVLRMTGGVRDHDRGWLQ